MTLSERQLLWYTRIQVFQDGGETSVAKQYVSVQRMYQWLKKTRSPSPQQPA